MGFETIAAALIIGGGVQSSISQFQQSRYNQAVANEQAKAVQQAREINRPIEREGFLDYQARLRALTGASGISLEGSPMQVMIESQNRFRRDQKIRDYEAELGVSRARSQADLFGSQAGPTLAGGLTGAIGGGIINYQLFN